jgi:ATP-dependent RNA helicase DBP3
MLIVAVVAFAIRDSTLSIRNFICENSFFSVDFFNGPRFTCTKPVSSHLFPELMGKSKQLANGTVDKSPKKRQRDDADPIVEPGLDEREAKRLRKEAKKAKKAEKLAKKAAIAENLAIRGQKIEEDKQVSDSESGPTPKVSAASSVLNSLEQSSATSPDLSENEVEGTYYQVEQLKVLPEEEVVAYLEGKDIRILDPLKQTRNCRPISSFDYLPSGGKTYSTVFASFSEPTPIQAATWPFIFAQRDVIGVAETGSGKTLAFGVPCLDRIRSLPEKQRRKIMAVIVSPTRELACQIHEQLEKLAKPANLHVACIYGGVPKDQQRIDLKRSQIVVATPGRLNDLISEKAADISQAEFVCLDEADRMLDKGFEEDIKKIISATAPSPSRQTVMFTATWPQSVRDLASTFMKSPVQIYIGNNPTGDLKANLRIEQKVEVIDPRQKDMRLTQILQQYQRANKKDRILVFCLYKKEATRVENFIRSKGFKVVGIHGDLAQAKRTASLQSFKSGSVPIMVATDVAARGLDIPAVKLVLNVTFPLTAEDYVHRIGRYVCLGVERYFRLN